MVYKHYVVLKTFFITGKQIDLDFVKAMAMVKKLVL